MVPTQVEALVGRAVVASLPATVPAATIPVWGPSAVILFGAQIPIFAMICSLLTLALIRSVYAARESKKAPGGHFLTGVLAMIIIGIVIDRQLTVGPAVLSATTIGAGGMGIVDMLKGRAGEALNVFFGKDPKT